MEDQQSGHSRINEEGRRSAEVVGRCIPAELDPEPGPEDRQLAAIAKALAHPVRAQIVRFLASRDTCMYGDLAEQLPLAQSTVSQHLKVLKESGLVRGTVEGPRVCYCIEPAVLRRLKTMVDELCESLKEGSQ